MRKKSHPDALPPRLLLVLLALLEQDCSPIELDELLGVPGRCYVLITELRALVPPGLIASKLTDCPMRYRVTDRAAAQRLVSLARSDDLAAARQRLVAHFNSDQGVPPPAVLLRRALARAAGLKLPTKKKSRAKPRRASRA